MVFTPLRLLKKFLQRSRDLPLFARFVIVYENGAVILPICGESETIIVPIDSIGKA